MNKLQQLIQNGYSVKTGTYISQGYEIFKKEIGLFVAYTFIYYLIIISISYVPFLGNVGTMVLGTPLLAGFFIVAHKIKRGEEVQFGDFFKGFDNFVELMLVGIISSLFIFIGIILLVIPGIYLAVAYTFAVLFVIFHQNKAWDALENSRKLIHRKWWTIFGFMLVLGLINILGFLLIGIGILFTYPITMCALYAAFDDIIGAEPELEEIHISPDDDQIVSSSDFDDV
jgi:uncharacterized membrane protein